MPCRRPDCYGRETKPCPNGCSADWILTNELRFMQKWIGVSCRNILQQKWVSGSGEVDWRDVPFVKYVTEIVE